MATYAELNNDDIVINIIVADDEFVKSQNDRNYVEYDKNNSAGIGYKYLLLQNKFITPQPFESWKLNSFYEWQAPKPYPNGGELYYWNEDSQEWTKEYER